MAKPEAYSESEIERRLAAELPGWTYTDGHLTRRYDTHNWKATAMAIGAIAHLAEAAWHHPLLTASFPWVQVQLQTHESMGITDRDFELARKIDEVLLWRPENEGGALTGIPDDPKFAYLKK
ncbi:MAG: 4a-hydroxytetrahydrobiopterin dehydratase [Alphaproteobacteria bacterium]